MENSFHGIKRKMHEVESSFMDNLKEKAIEEIRKLCETKFTTSNAKDKARKLSDEIRVLQGEKLFKPLFELGKLLIFEIRNEATGCFSEALNLAREFLMINEQGETLLFLAWSSIIDGHLTDSKNYFNEYLDIHSNLQQPIEYDEILKWLDEVDVAAKVSNKGTKCMPEYFDQDKMEALPSLGKKMDSPQLKNTNQFFTRSQSVSEDEFIGISQSELECKTDQSSVENKKFKSNLVHQEKRVSANLSRSYNVLLYLCEKLEYHRLAFIIAMELKKLYEKMGFMPGLVNMREKANDLEKKLTQQRYPKGVVPGDIPQLPNIDLVVNEISHEWYVENNRGLLQFAARNYDEAHKLFVENFILASRMENGDNAMCQTMINIGLVELQRQNYDNALKIFQQLLKLGKCTDNYFIKVTALYFIMIVLSQHEKLSNEDNENSSLLRKYSSWQVYYTNMLLKLYANQRGDNDSNYLKYLKEYNEIGYKRDVIIALHWIEKNFLDSHIITLFEEFFHKTMGDSYFKLGHFDIAENYYKNDYISEFGTKDLVFDINLKLYQIYYYKGDYQRARRRLHIMDQCVITNPTPNYSRFHQIFEEYSNYYFAIGNYWRACLAAQLQCVYSERLSNTDMIEKAHRNEQELRAIVDLLGIHIGSMSDEIKISIIVEKITE